MIREIFESFQNKYIGAVMAGYTQEQQTEIDKKTGCTWLSNFVGPNWVHSDVSCTDGTLKSTYSYNFTTSDNKDYQVQLLRVTDLTGTTRYSIHLFGENSDTADAIIATDACSTKGSCILIGYGNDRDDVLIMQYGILLATNINQTVCMDETYRISCSDRF